MGKAGLAFVVIFLAAFGIRKRAYRSNFGTLENWMQSHIYLGLLAGVVLLLHTGFRFNDGIAVATFVLVVDPEKSADGHGQEPLLRRRPASSCEFRRQPRERS